MNQFTGTEYVKLAIANAFGLDKELFEARLAWVDKHDMKELYSMVDDADEPPIYYAGLLALEDAKAGRPSGFMVGFDACSSGLQVMGALIGCETTCNNTGLIDPTVRADIYTMVTDTMNHLLKQKGIVVVVSRKDVKDATMTHFYGSTAQPKDKFGEDTEELAAFYEALEIVAPGGCAAMEHLMGSWQPFAPVHEWTLPDGFHSRCPVMVENDYKFEIDELDHTTFTYRMDENQGTEDGLSNAANVVHSIDGMLVREMNRRCNYDREALLKVRNMLLDASGVHTFTPKWEEFMSLRHVDFILEGKLTVGELEPHEVAELLIVIDNCLAHKPFPILCVHDELTLGSAA